MESITLSPEQAGTLAICAIRYGIGRRTYITSTLSDLVSSRVPQLSSHDLFIIRRDILTEWERDVLEFREYKRLGDDCDREAWMTLLARIDDELCERGELKPPNDLCAACGMRDVMCLCSHDR